jgi:hypothetical protein
MVLLAETKKTQLMDVAIADDAAFVAVAGVAANSSRLPLQLKRRRMPRRPPAIS